MAQLASFGQVVPGNEKRKKDTEVVKKKIDLIEELGDDEDGLDPKTMKRKIQEMQRCVLLIKKNRDTFLNVMLDDIIQLEDENVNPIRPSRSMEDLFSNQKLADDYTEKDENESYPGFKIEENEKLQDFQDFLEGKR